MRQMLPSLAALLIACSDDGPAGPPGPPTPPGPAPVASVTIQPPIISMGVGATLRLTVILRDVAGNVLGNRGVTFTSSNSTVAIVDGAGGVRALALGEATITATSEGKSGQTAISVEVNSPCQACWDYRIAR